MPVLPNGAEGWFAIPKWEKLGSSYGEALNKVLGTIKSKRPFYNCCEGQTDSKYLRQHAKTVKAFQKLCNKQKDHEILIIPAQFGLRHRGRSIHGSRNVFMPNEFGLGSFAVGTMLLTHPEREVQWEQLHVDCTGDEFDPEADGYDFSHTPSFFFSHSGKVEFRAFWSDSTDERFGSASGFLLQ